MAAINDLVGERGERIAGEGEAEEKRRTQGVGQLGAPPGCVCGGGVEGCGVEEKRRWQRWRRSGAGRVRQRLGKRGAAMTRSRSRRGSEGVSGGPAPGTRAMEEARAFGGGPALARARWGEGERKRARAMGRGSSTRARWGDPAAAGTTNRWRRDVRDGLRSNG
ncbi:hypothetical protein DAI22_08g172000 [Oryza sativa Japonica Group]|nr:hypothetical protein DAI22_08g172000 [Oryza sativa Japonica Group]